MTDDDLDLDLHTWRVPAPAPIDPSALVARALAPAAAPARRPRLVWIAAAMVVINAAIAALLVIVLARPGATRATTIVVPAGGGSGDPTVRELIAHLEQEQRELEHKLDELQQLRALVVELQDKLRRYDQQRDHTPAPADDSCDEVSCVLDNYAGSCCAKFHRPIPGALDRAAIASAIAAVRARVMACGDRFPAKGVVKVHAVVDGSGVVTKVSAETAPSTELGACVAAAILQASFTHTQRGGSFTYPFVF